MRQCGEGHKSQALQLQGDATSFGRVAVAGVGATLAAGGRVQQRLPGGSGGGSAAREAAEAALAALKAQVAGLLAKGGQL